jgi:rubredoxin
MPSQLDDGIKCPDCGAMAGYPDEEHSNVWISLLTCDNCGYTWQEVNDMDDPKENR